MLRGGRCCGSWIPVGTPLPVRMPFFSSGSCQLTFRDVSRMSLKLRCPTGPGTAQRHPGSARSPTPEGRSPRHPRDPHRERAWRGLPLPGASRGSAAPCFHIPTGNTSGTESPISGLLPPSPGAAGGQSPSRGNAEPPRTVLVGAHQLGGAARAVPRRGEAQHRGEVLGEFPQPGHVAHVDAVLEIGPHRHHRRLFLVLRLPGDELREEGAGTTIPGTGIPAAHIGTTNTLLRGTSGLSLFIQS